MKNKLFLGLATLLSFSIMGCNDDTGSTNVSGNEKLSNVRFASYDQITFRTSETISNYKIYADEAVVDSVDVNSEETNFKYTFSSKDLVNVTTY